MPNAKAALTLAEGLKAPRRPWAAATEGLEHFEMICDHVYCFYIAVLVIIKVTVLGPKAKRLLGQRGGTMPPITTHNAPRVLEQCAPFHMVPAHKSNGRIVSVGLHPYVGASHAFRQGIHQGQCISFFDRFSHGC